MLVHSSGEGEPPQAASEGLMEVEGETPQAASEGAMAVEEPRPGERGGGGGGARVSRSLCCGRCTLDATQSTLWLDPSASEHQTSCSGFQQVIGFQRTFVCGAVSLHKLPATDAITRQHMICLLMSLF